ncbi:MAG: adenylate/guanylate cyclase domain-containing protein [Salinisphaeraceae bacterium]|nr:adenylate/guanylate cyclase domain-containing protein [Salinisphaeraceae bacterium]
MQCLECAHDNPATARFCNACGTALPAACSSCGHENPVAAKFCNQCGSSLAEAPAQAKPVIERTPGGYTPRHLAEQILTSRSALEGERKRVTVLFADVKGSTELAEAVGDEEWHQILDRFFGILTSGVHRYEGTINQYTGDGIMALFGAPIAHEDHALRACRAALEMQTELRAYADELRISKGLNLSVRTGINSGEVVVGKIGDDLRMDYTAKGQTVNLAARMEQIAEPGRIYLTSYTAKQVEGYVRLRDLGRMPIKGISEPVNVFELEGGGQLKTRLELSRARGLSRFIGRADELQQLEQALREASEGQGQTVAVVGNGGIGKSRLCYELIERARGRDIPVYTATGVPYANAVPLFPVLGLLLSYFVIDEQDPPAEQRRKIAGTLALLGHDCRESMQLLFEYLDVAEPGAAPSAIPADQRQQQLFEMMCKALPGSQKPSVIVIEDLHWADAPTEVFLQAFSDAVAESHSLLLLNYRPEYMADWLVPRLQHEIALNALSEEEVGQMVAELLGDDASLGTIHLRIRQQAAGNPFFVEEAIRSLTEQGYLEGSYGQYRLVKEVTDMVIPDTVQGILAARIDRLSEQEKDVLSHAAVIGKSFSAERLAQLIEVKSDALGESLHSLEEGGFVHSTEEEGDFDFCHPLTQEVAYRGQLGERRARIHARLAEVIESELDGRDHDERSLLLAHHWERAGEGLKAAHWQLQAAVFEGVMRESAGALIRYRKAIELADAQAQGPERDRLAILARAGVLRTASVLHVAKEETDKAAAEAQALAESLDDPLVKAELLIAHSSLELQQGDADVAVELASEAMRIARELNNAELVSRFRIPILLSYFSAGRLSEGLESLNEVGQAPWYEGPITEANFLSRAFRALMLTYMGQLDEAQRDLRQAIEVEGKAGRTVSWMHANLVDVARMSGRFDMAMREARHAVAQVEQFGSPFFREVAYRALAIAQGLNGNWEESRRLLEEYLPDVRPGEAAHQFEAAHMAHLAEAYLRLGQRERALQTAQEALASAQAANMRVWECQVRWILARILLDNRQPKAAAEQLDALNALIDTTGAVSFRPYVLAEQAKLSDDEQQQKELLMQAESQLQAMGADPRVLAHYSSNSAQAEQVAGG